jgi:hypothetical protein
MSRNIQTHKWYKKVYKFSWDYPFNAWKEKIAQILLLTFIRFK